MALTRHQQLESDILWLWRICQKFMRFVVGGDDGAQSPGSLSNIFERVIVMDNRIAFTS